MSAARWFRAGFGGCWLAAVLAACAATSATAASFYPLAPDGAPLAGVVDQSALNRPLTNADRIVAERGHFYTVGPDGKAGTADDRRVRLYGTNLSFGAAFPAPAEARQLARRLRSLGFNAVRLPHLDTQPDTRADSSRSVLRVGPYPSFNARSLERLKGLIQALKDEGIYLDLVLYVAYPFRPALDHLPPLANHADTMPPGSPVQIFHPRLVELQVNYAKSLLQALDLANDAGLATVEIRNESSIANTWSAWDSRDWHEAIQGDYADELTRQWNDWLKRRYGSLAKACEHHGNCDGSAAVPLLVPEEGDVLRTGQHNALLGRVVDKLRVRLGALAHGAGPVDAAQGPSAQEQRLSDFVQFLAETDQNYLERMKRAVREVNPLVPLTGTQIGFGGTLNFLSHGGMDYLDEHFYVDHYDFAHTAWDMQDWRIRDLSLTGSQMKLFVDLAKHRDLSRPFVVSEYNQPFPNRQAQEIIPVTAVVAALQDWDGLYQFDYASDEQPPTLPSGFQLAGDWAKLATAGQAAQLFRQGEVAALSALATRALGRDKIIADAARRVQEGRGPAEAVVEPWTPQGIFQSRLGVALMGAPLQPTVASATGANSVTRFDAQQARVLIDTAQFAGFAGKFAPGQKIAVGALSLEPLDAQRGFATVLLSALDGRAIAQSRHLLLSVPGAALGSQPGATPARPKNLIAYAGQPEWLTLEPDSSARAKPSGALQASPPLWMERVPMKLFLRSEAAEATVFGLTLRGERAGALPMSAVRRVAGGFEIRVQEEAQPLSPWYEIVLRQGAAGPH